MANVVAKAVMGVLEKMFSCAEVVAVRKWKPGTMVEIELHIPGVDMGDWKSIKRLKTKVGECEYRDYTPADWDAERSVCTMYIETGHEGTGSNWGNNVKRGDEVLYGPAHATVLPSKPGRILGLGDGSALGHFLALKKLTGRQDYPIDVTVFLADDYVLPKKLVSDNTEFEFITNAGGNAFKALAASAARRDLGLYTSIYIAGNSGMVRDLKKMLRYRDEVTARFYGAEFWK